MKNEDLLVPFVQRLNTAVMETNNRLNKPNPGPQPNRDTTFEMFKQLVSDWFIQIIREIDPEERKPLGSSEHRLPIAGNRHMLQAITDEVFKGCPCQVDNSGITIHKGDLLIWLAKYNEQITHEAGLAMREKQIELAFLQIEAIHNALIKKP